MPIIGSTDRGSWQPTRGFPLIARLQKGMPRTEADLAAKRPGGDLDYFMVKFEAEYGHLKPMFETMYGEKPQALPRIKLLGGIAEQAFPTWMESWVKSGLQIRCDGQHQVEWYDPALGGINRECRACIAPKCDCKRVGRLYFRLPDFERNTGVMGYFVLTTHSRRDVEELTGLLFHAELLSGNNLVRIPFELGRKPVPVSIAKRDKQGKPTGERVKLTKSFLYLKVMEVYVQKLLAAPAAEPTFAPQQIPAVAQSRLGEVDTTTGEILQEDVPEAPTEPTPSPAAEAPTPWLATEAGRQRLKKVLEEVGYTEADKRSWLNGLAIERFSEFAGTEAELYARLRQLSQSFKGKPGVARLTEADIPNPFVAVQVKYIDAGDNHKYLLLADETDLLQVRGYGRTTEFKKMVGDDYYAANGFADLPLGSPNPRLNKHEGHQIAPLTVTWEAKGPEGARYLVVKQAVPLGDAPPTGKALLNQWFDPEQAPGAPDDERVMDIEF